jgi:hypothetical protein
MTDEKYSFLQDVRDRKRVARGAHNKRTHCGKGGAIKFPSDYMTRKELKAMSGEVKSYNINEPMKWKEFKALPDDIKIVYIKALREKFGVSDKRIGTEMMGVSQTAIAVEVGRLGIKLGKGTRFKFDKAAWMNWLYKDNEEIPVESHDNADESVSDPAYEIAQADTENNAEVANKAIVPYHGTVDFRGNANEVLNTLSVLLGGASVHLRVTWEVEGDAE